MNVNSMSTASSRTIIHGSSPAPSIGTPEVTLRNHGAESKGDRKNGDWHASILAEKSAFRELSALFGRDLDAHWREQEHTTGHLVDGAAQREGEPGREIHQ